MDRVIFGEAKKDFGALPKFIIERLRKWAHDVEILGLEEVRKIPGYHDEPLKGSREGQRSIRLNRSYRAIYVIFQGSETRVISIREVHKHEY